MRTSITVLFLIFVFSLVSAANCVNECENFLETKCYSDLSGYAICTDYDSDDCLEWKNEFYCSSDEICSNGACVLKESPSIESNISDIADQNTGSSSSSGSGSGSGSRGGNSEDENFEEGKVDTEEVAKLLGNIVLLDESGNYRSWVKYTLFILASIIVIVILISLIFLFKKLKFRRSKSSLESEVQANIYK